MSVRREGLGARLLVPEILDDLPENDARAIASRRDLGRVNLLMFQVGIMADLLRSHVARPPRRLLEIGCGDGSFMLRVAQRLAKQWPAVEVTLLDRQDLVTEECLRAFGALGWTARSVRADVFAWLDDAHDERFDAVSANLFLHHFEDAHLVRLFEGAARLAPVFAATEPRRASFPLTASRLLWVIGANDVTRHDAPASVRAGFAGTELSDLWPAQLGTLTQERRRGLFTHAFAAVRPVPGDPS